MTPSYEYQLSHRMKERVQLCEVGPRDGFQFEKVPIPTRLKADVIRGLMKAGVKRIQATSFVHPKKVPQMADAEELLTEILPEARASGVEITALALNVRGVERAIAAGVPTVDLSIALNPQHAQDNANSTVEAGIEAADAMTTLAQDAGLKVQLGFQTVWGYAQPDDTPHALIRDIVTRFRGRGLESISLGDTTGMAAPDSTRAVVNVVREADPETPIVVHLHDTRGLGLVNIAAALDEGIRRFDTSMGGLGGCPFIPGATGNVATEDVDYLVERLGLETGINRSAVATLSQRMELHLGHKLSGRMYGLL